MNGPPGGGPRLHRFFILGAAAASRPSLACRTVEFAETFVAAYTGKQWIDKERARLVKAIEDAEREEQQ